MSETVIRPSLEIGGREAFSFQDGDCSIPSFSHPAEIGLVGQTDRAGVPGVGSEPRGEVWLNFNEPVASRILGVSDVN
jgi:hypothetical protein